MHQCIKFILFWNDTLHVSNGLSVHHQDIKNVNTATGICQTDTAECLLASRQQYLFDICLLLYVHSVEQKSIGLKFSKSRTGSDVRYSCHHNSSRFTSPIFAHSWRFSVFHSLQSHPVYINRRRYSLDILMTDGKTVRNRYSVLQK